MTLRITPLVFFAALGLAKFILLIEQGSRFDQIAWLAGTVVWCWLGWAFWKDKDMPAYSGSFGYKNGENDFARAIYIIVMMICFLLGLIGI